MTLDNNWYSCYKIQRKTSAQINYSFFPTHFLFSHSQKFYSLIINPRRIREGYGSHSVCVCRPPDKIENTARTWCNLMHCTFLWLLCSSCFCLLWLHGLHASCKLLVCQFSVLQETVLRVLHDSASLFSSYPLFFFSTYYFQLFLSFNSGIWAVHILYFYTMTKQ